MATVVRYFKCMYCKVDTPFELDQIAKPGANSIKCIQCSRNWVGTMLPSCCNRVDILWGFSGVGVAKPVYQKQSFPK